MKSLALIFKESFVISALIKIVNAFIAAYNNSRLKKNMAGIAVCFKKSVTYRILSAYANKKPYYRYSFVYRIIMAIAGLFDKFFGWINSFVTGWLSGSRAAEDTVKVCNASVESKFMGFGILFMSIAAGSIIALIYAGGMSVVNGVMCIAVFVLGFLCVAVSLCKGVLKGSAVLRLFAEFIDLIR